MSGRPAERAIEFICQNAWAMTQDSLRQMLNVAHRTLQETPEAVATRLGRPLENSRDIEMREGIAIIPVIGPIFRYANLFTRISGATSVQDFALDFHMALEDPSVRGIVLDVNSPGGTVAGISELAGQIFAARSRKSVLAYIGAEGASGAYWLASAANQIIVNDTALVGSIGVVAAQRPGPDDEIEIVSSQSPRKRNDARTAEGRADIQRMVDDLADVFIEAVASNRGIEMEAVLSDFGQGGLLVGTKAVDAGMADDVGVLEKIIAGFSGDSQRGNLMNAKTTIAVTEITREYIAENHQSIAEAFRAEGVATVDLTAARAEGHKAGLGEAGKASITAERERIGVILRHDEAKSRTELAHKLAFETSMSPEDAAGLLAAAPKTSAKSSDPLAAAMAKEPEPDIGADLPGDVVTTATGIDTRQIYADRAKVQQPERLVG